MNLQTTDFSTLTSANAQSGITRNHLTFQERVALMDELKKVLVAHPDGKCAYAKGWSDERIAKEFLGGKATVLNVSLLRKKCFGNLAKFTKPKAVTTASRISKLELRIASLELHLNTLTNHVARHTIGEKVLLNPDKLR